MKILRNSYIEGYKDGANAILRDSLDEAAKTPVKYNGKALSEMLRYAEEIEDEIPGMAAQSYDEERTYSRCLQDVINDCLNHVDTMKIDNFTILPDKSEGDSIVISGGLNGHGIWSSYFETLSKLMFQIELRYPGAYVVKLVNDCLDDVFYLTVRIPKDDEEERVFSAPTKEPPKEGNKSPGDRDIVPDYIVQKVRNGEGVIHKYKGYWRIVSMKTNPPTFWDAHYKSKADAMAALKNFHSRH